MSNINTRIYGGQIAIHCITYRSGYQNQVISNGQSWEEGSPGYFRIPEIFNIEDHVYVGAIDNGRFEGKIVRAKDISNKRITWEIVGPFLQASEVDESIKNSDDERRNTLIQRAKDLKKRKPNSEVWFRSVLEEIGLIGYTWNSPVLDKFILDFAWPIEKIAVEVDGKNHETLKQQKYDAQREKILIHAGWTIFRFKYPDEPFLIEKLKDLNLALYRKRCGLIENYSRMASRS